MNTIINNIPNGEGFWKRQSDGKILEVYKLEPVNDILCVWCGDVGAALDATIVWDTDEWLGHIPVIWWCNNDGPYEYLGKNIK